LKLLQIRLLVKDFKKSVLFYRDKLELPVSLYEEELQYALFNNGETKIEILPQEVLTEAIGEKSKPIKVEVQSKFLLQFKVENVNKAYQHFREKNIEFVSEPHDRKDWGARIAQFRDPDGNLIEIYKMLQEE